MAHGKIAQPTARQRKDAAGAKRTGTGALSGWSFSTSMRNPERLAQILSIVLGDARARARQGLPARVWTPDTQVWLYEAMKEAGFYNESDKGSTQVPDPTRGRTAASPAAQLGLLRAKANQPLQLTDLGLRYAKTLKSNDSVFTEDLMLLALYRLRMTLDASGKPSHLKESATGAVVAPLGHILDLFLDPTVVAAGLSLRRAKYLVPLATSAAAAGALVAAATSTTFERDLPALVRGDLNTLGTYGDTVIRYLKLSGLFKIDDDRIILAPGREDQARRIRDALVAPQAAPSSWAAYRQGLEAPPPAVFPWHGTAQQYAADCQALADALEAFSGVRADYDPQDPSAHIALRRALGRAQEHAYLTNGTALSDLPGNLATIRQAGGTGAGRPSALGFEVAVLRAGAVLGGIGRFAPNYIKDMRGNPTAHAAGKDGDGWLHGAHANGPHLLLEASLLGGRDQNAKEWEPAKRHLLAKRLEDQPIDQEAAAGLLVMPSLHEDAISACVRDARDLHLEERPGYCLLVTPDQYARLLEPAVAGGAALATLDELVEWVQATCRTVGQTFNGKNPAVYLGVVNDAIDAWTQRLLARAAALDSIATSPATRPRRR